MKLNHGELEFLSAWAREEWEPECYRLPAHKLQIAHHVPGHLLIAFIKAWTLAEQKKDHEILEVAGNPNPTWPWKSDEEMKVRLHETSKSTATRDLAEQIA